MVRTLDFIVKLVLLLTFAYGLWLLLGGSISSLIQDLIREDSVLKKSRKGMKRRNRLIKHLAKILSVVSKKDDTQAPYLFLAGSILLFFFSFFMLLKIQGVFKAFVTSILISVAPYLILQARLHTIRISSSYEGNTLVTGIINNYKQNNFNGIEAVDKTACSDQIGFFSKNNLLRLSLALKSYRSEQELDEAIKTFVFAYNTEWAILLGMNIKIAAYDGTNVCTSMEDILVELKSVGETIEANKRYNNESFSMIKYLLIPMYFFTVYLSINAFGFTFKRFIQYQFFTSIGLNFAIITFTSIALCFLVYSLAKRPKYDI